MGDANITRSQFTEFKTDGSTVMLKYMQQGTYIADSDFNEVGQISSQRAARHLWNLIKRQNSRFSTGWTITGGSNQVTVSAGDAALLVNLTRAGALLATIADSDKAYIFHLASNTNVTCPTQTTTRTDCLYLDVTIPIIDSSTGEDQTLVNPAIGKETAVDQRLKFAFAVYANSSVPPTPVPSGHYYVAIATIARTASATIPDNTITNLLDQYNTVDDTELVVSYLKSDGTRTLTGDLAVTSGKLIDGIDLSAIPDILYAQSLIAGFSSADTITDWGSVGESAWVQTGSTSYVKKLRLSYFKRPNAKKLYVGFDAYGSSANLGFMRVTVAGCTPIENAGGFPTVTGWQVQTPFAVDISALSTGADANILIELKTTNGGVTVGIRKVVVWTQED
jgi:hypothetical protein